MEQNNIIIQKVKNHHIYTHYLLACFVGGALLGSLIFILIYGICPLDVENIAYIMNERTDLPGFYIGWMAYRNAGWENGIGAFNTLCYPNLSSYGILDIVPILGLFFKIISPVLPETFQFVGLWGLICFFMQGGFAALIVRKFSGNNVISVLFSLPFILATPVLTKLFYHHSEAGQWVLLMVFAFWVYNADRDYINLKEYFIWALIGILTTGICIYFIPMVGMILVGYSINKILNNKKNILSSVVNIFSYLIGCILFLALMQSFNSYVADGDFYNEYVDRLYRCGANLNAFINSWGIAFFGRFMGVAKDGQGEGLAYLGMGMLVALVVAASYKSVLVLTSKDNKGHESRRRNFNISLTVVFILSLIVAIGPTLSFGSKIICYLPYPEFVLKFWCNFRSTGRMIWPAYYIIYIFIFKILFDLSYVKSCKEKFFRIILMGFCCVIQVIDLSPCLIGKHEYFAHYQELNTAIHDEAWSKLGDNYKHMIVLPNSLINRSNERFDLWTIAIDNNLTLNDFYFARQNITDQTPVYQEKFEKGEFDEDSFYVIPYSYLPLFMEYNLYCYKLDDYIVMTKEDIGLLINKKEIDKKTLKGLLIENEDFSFDGINYLPVFDPVYYYYSYSDVWNLDLSDVEAIFNHFITIGMQQGRKASQSFSPIEYKKKNEDVRLAIGEDWKEYYLHYLIYGINENRQCN